MKSETIAGWNPELEGKLSGERERAARRPSKRSVQLQKDRGYFDAMGKRVELYGREHPKMTDDEASVVPRGVQAGRDIADRFVLEIAK